MRATRIKAILVALLVIIAAGTTVAVFLYRAEDLVPSESDLAKYPEFAPFLAGKTSFRGIRFNVDTNLYSFAFGTNASSADAFFSTVTKALSDSEWKLVESNATYRTYVRPLPRSPEHRRLERVRLTFSPATREVTFVRDEIAGSY